MRANSKEPHGYTENSWHDDETNYIGNRGFYHQAERIGLWILYDLNGNGAITKTVSFKHIMENVKDITPKNESGSANHGHWIQYWGNGIKGYECNWDNGTKIGLELEYNQFGKLIHQSYHIK